MVKVRRDDGTVETFNKSKIINSILKETGCSGESVIKIVDEVYVILCNSGLDLIHGPLIREVVNTKFLEHGMRDCQRKYTRVGLPIYDARKYDTGAGNGDNANLQDSPETVHKRKADALSKEQCILMFPEHVAEAHLNGFIHIHDLEYFTTRQFCYDQDLRYIFKYGLVGDGVGEHTSWAYPANRPEVAILHAVKALCSSQTNCAGGQGYYNFLTFLAPYFINSSYEQIYQCMEMFIFEMTQNLVARGSQVVFSSVQLTPGVPDIWKDKPCVFKGKIHNGVESELLTYSECEREVRLLFKAMMEVMIKGDAKGKPFYFPKPEIGFEPAFLDESIINTPYKDTPSYYDLYLKSFELAAKYGTPYFDNMIPPFRGAGKGISCYQCSVLPDTLVQRVNTHGHVELINIEELNNIDTLVTPSGPQTFDHVMIHNINEDVYTIILDGGRRITGTYDHKIPIAGRGFVECKDINIGDEIQVICELPSSITLTPYLENSNSIDIYYLLGVYAAEGHSSIGNVNDHHITIGININEIDFKEKIVSCIKNVFNYDAKIYNILERNGTTIAIHGKPYYNYITSLMKCNGYEMEIPCEVLNAPENCKWAFIMGYFRGDGCLRKNGKKSNVMRIEMNTVSKKLAEGMLLLLGSLGYDFKYTISKDKRENRKMRHILTLNKKDDVVSFLACNTRSHVDTFLKVKKITTSNYCGKVYDPVEVLPDHSFITAQGIVSGNCAFSFSTNLQRDSKFNDKLYFNNGEHFSMGSWQVVTLNLPRYAYESEGNLDKFYTMCYNYIDLCIDIFKLKREWVSDVAHPFLTQTHSGSQLCDFNSLVYTIGILGINEVIEILFGKSLHETREMQIEALRICNRLKEYCKQKTIETGMEIAFSRTPAETTAQRFAVLDLLAYGNAHKYVKGNVKDAICKYANTGSRDLPIYYTNGPHVKFDPSITMSEKIRIEQAFFPILDGGDICNIYLGETMPDPRGLMDMTLKICKTTNLGYFAFTRDMTIRGLQYERYHN